MISVNSMTKQHGRDHATSIGAMQTIKVILSVYIAQIEVATQQLCPISIVGIILLKKLFKVKSQMTSSWFSLSLVDNRMDEIRYR